MASIQNGTATREEEEITDLEAFHHELQSSLGLVRQMVSSWLPSGAQISKFPAASSEDVASIPRGRPERLGIGATAARPYSSTSTADTAETRKLKGMLGSSDKEKRKIRDETQSMPGARAAKAGSDIDDDEDSRSRALSVKKPKLAAASTTSFFHEKPSSRKETQTPVAAPVSKPKIQKLPAASTAPEAQEQAQINGQSMFAAPAPPRLAKNARAEIPADAPAKATQNDAALAEVEEDEEEDGNASIMTESTLQSISTEATAGKNDSKAAKRKRNKANRKRRQQEEEARLKSQTQSSTGPQNGMLFGDSVVE